MKELSLDLPKDSRPFYLRLAEALRLAIQAGSALPGEALPSTRELADRFGTHRHTVMAAVAELVAEGWVLPSERRSYRVIEGLPEPTTPEPLRPSRRQHRWRLARELPQDVPLPSAKIRHSFQSGLPDLRLFPSREFRSHQLEALRRTRQECLGFSDARGSERFLSELATYLRRMRGVVGRELIATHGSQEAIYLAARLLLAPGDAVAVEATSYPPAWTAFRSCDAKLIPVRSDANGIDPDDLERAARRRKIRLLYLTPLHQYPTTVTLSAPRRLKIYEIASRFNIPILEDDYDHEFHFRCQPLPPLASQDPEGRVIYVSTFTKVLYPSTRLGFLAVPTSLAPALIHLRSAVSRQSDLWLQETAALWIRSGELERHLRRMRRHYEERRDTMAEQLQAAKRTGLPLDFQVPDGGMALWLNTGCDSTALAFRAREQGLHVLPEQYFRLDRKNGVHLRLGFANQTPSELRAGLRIFLKLLKPSRA